MNFDQAWLDLYYIPNDSYLMAHESLILKSYLDARPDWLTVDLPKPISIGDERGVLLRHGFQIEYIAPFSEAFYFAAEHLLKTKPVTEPVMTEREKAVSRTGGELKVTRNELFWPFVGDMALEAILMGEKLDTSTAIP